MADPRRTAIGVALAGALAIAAGGCISGSLAANTGAGPGESWSTASRQAAHVGETVELSFVLKKPLENKSIDAIGLADYCVFSIAGEHHDVDVNGDGAFLLSCPLTDMVEGDAVRIQAAAYREVGARDYRRIADQWVAAEHEGNEPDQWIASAGLTLEMYQSRLRLPVQPHSHPLDWTTGRLVLQRRDGRETIVYAEKPPRRGFQVAPLPNGGWEVTYTPGGNDVNPTGTTLAVFSVFDESGERQEYHQEFATP